MKILQQVWFRKVASTAVLALAVALLTTHFTFQQTPTFAPGEIASQDVEASTDFEYVDDAAWQERKVEVQAAQPLVFDLDLTKIVTLEHRINKAFERAREGVSTEMERSTIQQRFAEQLGLRLSESDAEQFETSGWSVEVQQVALRMLEESMQFYIIDVASEIPATGQLFEVHRRFDGQADVVSLDDPRNIRTLAEVQQYVSVLVSNMPSVSESSRYLGAMVARESLQVNFSYNHAKTEQVRAESVEGLDPIYRHVNRGQSIVRKGDRVDETQAQMLLVLERLQQGGIGGYWGEFVARFGLALFLIVALYLFAENYIRKFASTVRDIEAMSVLSMFILVCAKLLLIAALPLSEMVGFGMSHTALWYAVPLPAGAMVMRILTNSETTLVWTIGMSLFLAFGMEQDVFMACFFLISGVMAAASLTHTRDRMNVLRSGLQTGLLTAAVALLNTYFHLDAAGSMDSFLPLWEVSFAIVGGVASAFLTLGLLPLFESIGFVTDYKMLELANLNHPLLRQLFVRAPGTYHHSMTMAQLSEAAAEAIGANALHAKVACYYHDIGKSLQPHFFIENQRGVNPHDNLEPHQSARVIQTHVIDGIAMAKQHNLPQPIIDAIEMHHGTSLMKYFYIRALENAVEGEVVDENDFRYNARRPNTREAGIIFLADRVEAACRTLKEPSQEDFAKMISQLVNSAITEGQFEECPLTLRELYIIMDVFTTTMTNMYHHRIEYPKMPSEVPSSAVITLEAANPLLQDVEAQSDSKPLDTEQG